jgi:hypothetical protein
LAQKVFKKDKIPNLKHQITNKSQISISNDRKITEMVTYRMENFGARRGSSVSFLADQLFGISKNS